MGLLVRGVTSLNCAPLSLDGPVHEPACDADTLKIIIVGTPKAGNTWLNYLLAELYVLDRVELDADFREVDWKGLGPRWVGQQHYPPEPELLEIAREHGIVFVTPVRHPGDVFVSLRHYADNRDERDEAPEFMHAVMPDSMLEDGPGVFGEATRAYARNGFYLKLHLSLYWLRGGWSHGVRYEEMWQRPVETFKALTDRIVPMPLEKLRHALCACEIGLMRANHDPKGKFVRKGGLGSWRDEMDPELQSILRDDEPYPAQLAALGYSMDLEDKANERVTTLARAGNPFPGGKFANGVPLAAIHLRAYFSLTREDSSRWADGGAVGPGTFYDWLMSPAEADPSGGKAIPVITEFAHYLYSIREDLPQVFPDPFGQDRRALGDWFLYSAIEDFRFDWSFTLPVVKSWAVGRTES